MTTYASLILDFNKKFFVDETLFSLDYIESKLSVGKNTLYVDGKEDRAKYGIEYYPSLTDNSVKCTMALDCYVINNKRYFSPSVPVKNEHLAIFDLVNNHRALFNDMFLTDNIKDITTDYMSKLLMDSAYFSIKYVNGLVEHELICFKRDILSYDKQSVEFKRSYQPVSLTLKNGEFSGIIIARFVKNIHDKYDIIVDDFNNLNKIEELIEMVKI